MARNLLLDGLERLAQLIRPLRLLATGGPAALERFSRETGWLFVGDIPTLIACVNQAIAATDQLVALVVDLKTQPTLPELDALLDLVETLSASLASAAEGVAVGVLGLADEPELRRAFLRDLRDLLLLNDLARRSPGVLAVLCALGLAEQALVPALYTADQRRVRAPGLRWCFFPERLGPLLTDPGDYLERLYLPASPRFDDEAARQFITVLCVRLGPLAQLAGARIDSHSSPLPAAILPDLAVLVGDPQLGANRRANLERFFRSASFLWLIRGASSQELGIAVEALPAGITGPSGLVGPGLELRIAGHIDHTVTTDQWSVHTILGADIDVLGLSRTEVRLGNGAPSLTSRIDLQVPGPMILGASRGPRLELAALHAYAFAELDPALAPEAGFGLALDHLGLTLAPGECDDFLGALLPTIAVDFSAELAWSRSRGLYLAGEAGLTARVPIDLRLPGLEIPYLDLDLTATGPALGASVRTLVLAALGPVALAIDGLGVCATLDLAEPAPAADVQLLPPRSIALAMAIPGVLTAAGILVVDVAAGRYGGAAIVSTPWFEAAAIGVITTHTPWSLFVSLAASFAPAIQLGYGFMLSGVGGVFAANRELDPPGLIAALRGEALRTVLFPQADAVLEHIDETLGLIDTVFPVKRGSFVFGPLLRLDWGPGPVLRAVLGVIVSLPDPLRIAVIGQISLRLPPVPDSELPVKPLLDLNMDVVGILDLGARTFSLDGRLYDSHLAQIYALSGDIAFRADLGPTPSFLLSIGGFHPSFVPPADVGVLERATMAFEQKRNAEDPESESVVGFALQGYFALTANSVQAGARFDFWARLAGFSLTGGAGFNAILWLKPLVIEFDADLTVCVARGERRLFGVDIVLHARGPRPWRLWGRAAFDFFGFPCSKSFDFTLSSGSGDAGELETVDIAAMLDARLADGRAWDVRPGPGKALTLRDLDDPNVVRVAPDAALECRTQVVPLGRTIERLGADLPRTPADRGPFTVPQVTLISAGHEQSVVPRVETEWFSPGKYIELDHEARLTTPSFERMPGIVVVGGDTMRVGPVVIADGWDDSISRANANNDGGFYLEPLAL